MSELETLQKENKHLRDLLEQLYEMPFLDDMITSACLDRDDDEMLLCNLSLRSEIRGALYGNSPFPKRNLVSKLKFSNAKDSFKIKGHNNSSVLEEHYSKVKD